MNPFAVHPVVSAGRSDRERTVQVLCALLEGEPLRQVRFQFWDGSYWPNERPRAATVVLHHSGSLREMLSGGSQLALGEAYIHNDFDIEGDLEAAFEFTDILINRSHGWSKKLKIASLLKQLPDGKPQNHRWFYRQPDLNGHLHSPDRDKNAIQFHYDISNDFYALWLDSRKVYSCAYFEKPDDDLEKAQLNKLDLICRKLDLKPEQRFLDIGCGWGGLLLHAVSHYGVRGLGITLSERQAEYARELVRQKNLEDRIEIRVQDYRDLNQWGTFDAIASVGMVEHVGRHNLPQYFSLAHRLLKPGGLFLNHGIGTGVIPMLNQGESFMDKYVFPDADLFPIVSMLEPAEALGFEIRDVENLREHYAWTLRQWVRRLESHHAEALQYVSEPVYRIWQVYMAGSARGFHVGQLAIYQSLLAKLDKRGRANYPVTRAGWYRSR